MNEAVISSFFMPAKFESFIVLVVVLWALGIIVLVVQLYRDRHWQVAKAVARHTSIFREGMEIMKGVHVWILRGLLKAVMSDQPRRDEGGTWRVGQHDFP
jgi:hypothetical protein